jgi:hypothetical protein
MLYDLRISRVDGTSWIAHHGVTKEAAGLEMTLLKGEGYRCWLSLTPL